MTNRNLENLHLLPAFKAILEEGSVVDAARRLDLTQSAVSKHLARLREWFDDPLFVRTRDGMMPTPRATELAAGIGALLADADRLTAQQTVDPATFEGTFTLSATDEVLCRILPPLLAKLEAQAPNLRLITVPLAPDYSLHELETGAVNLLVAVNWHAPEVLRQGRLMQDRFVVAMHVDNPLAQGPLTLADYADARHILVAPLGMETGTVDALLAPRGLQRRVIASVPVFGLVTPDLLGPKTLVTLPERVALRMAETQKAVITDLPLPAPPITYHALWHPRFDREPRLRWVRAAVQAALSDVSLP